MIRNDDDSLNFNYKVIMFLEVINFIIIEIKIGCN